jgi:hypothetical protein
VNVSRAASLRSAEYKLDVDTYTGKFKILRRAPHTNDFYPYMDMGGQVTLGTNLVSDLNELEWFRHEKKWWQRRG